MLWNDHQARFSHADRNENDVFFSSNVPNQTNVHFSNHISVQKLATCAYGSPISLRITAILEAIPDIPFPTSRST